MLTSRPSQIMRFMQELQNRASAEEQARSNVRAASSVYGCIHV